MHPQRLSLIAAALLTAGIAAGSAAPEFDGTGWAGGAGYTLSQLRGKAVVLYFYEAG